MPTYHFLYSNSGAQHFRVKKEGPHPTRIKKLEVWINKWIGSDLVLVWPSPFLVGFGMVFGYSKVIFLLMVMQFTRFWCGPLYNKIKMRFRCGQIAFYVFLVWSLDRTKTELALPNPNPRIFFAMRGCGFG